MAHSQRFVLLSLLLHSILLLSYNVICDEEENLPRGINSYRATLNLTALTDNEKPIALQTSSRNNLVRTQVGPTANTIPGPQFPNYPKILAKCKLNVTTTKDGAFMPACVPRLDANIVLSNYTETQYAGFLNVTKFSGVGIGSEDDWIAVILTTNNLKEVL